MNIDTPNGIKWAVAPNDEVHFQITERANPRKLWELFAGPEDPNVPGGTARLAGSETWYGQDIKVSSTLVPTAFNQEKTLRFGYNYYQNRLREGFELEKTMILKAVDFNKWKKSICIGAGQTVNEVRPKGKSFRVRLPFKLDCNYEVTTREKLTHTHFTGVLPANATSVSEMYVTIDATPDQDGRAKLAVKCGGLTGTLFVDVVRDA